MSDEKNRRMVEQVTRALLGKLGEDIEFLKSHGIGVTIFAFTFEPGAIAYISTSEREGMLRSIKEFIAYQDAGLSSEPRGERGRT